MTRNGALLRELQAGHPIYLALALQLLLTPRQHRQTSSNGLSKAHSSRVRALLRQ